VYESPPLEISEITHPLQEKELKQNMISFASGGVVIRPMPAAFYVLQ
jgi:hypothetical protein